MYKEEEKQERFLAMVCVHDFFFTTDRKTDRQTDRQTETDRLN